MNMVFLYHVLKLPEKGHPVKLDNQEFSRIASGHPPSP